MELLYRKGVTMMNKSDEIFNLFLTLNKEEKSHVLNFVKQLVFEEQKSGNNE